MKTCDLHVDTPWVVAKYGSYPEDLSDVPASMLSFEWLKAGGLDSAVFVMYMPDHWYEAGFGEETLRKQATWAKAQATPDFTVHLALEGWRIDRVSREFVEWLKPKYVTLVHATSNELAESCTDLNGNGLTDEGYEAVMWLQKQGILVDLSHASVATCIDVLGLTEAPVIASHSGARAVTDHPRNMDDEIIRLIADAGGVIGVPLVRNFVGDVNGFRDHVEHIVDLVGPDHVAIGSDMDGAVMIEGLESAAEWGGLVREVLVSTGMTGDEIEGIMGGNALRLFESVGSTIQKEKEQC